MKFPVVMCIIGAHIIFRSLITDDAKLGEMVSDLSEDASPKNLNETTTGKYIINEAR